MKPSDKRPDRSIISRYIQEVLNHIDELVDQPFLLEYEPIIRTIADGVCNITVFSAPDILKIENYIRLRLQTSGFDSASVNSSVKRVFDDILRNVPRGLLSAQDILQREESTPKWVINNFLPVGLLSLAGRPKIGKSWLALQFARAVSHGGIIFGQQIVSAPVLYIACEDPEWRLRKRMITQGWDLQTSNCHFLTLQSFRDEVGNLNGNGSVKLAELINIYKFKMVVIDTLSRAITGDQNDVGQMTAALAPLQKVAYDSNAAIILVDHHNKSLSTNRDPTLNILGSTAKAAVVNTVLALYREPGKGYAVLKILGHDVIENEYHLILDSDTGIWNLDGSEPVSLPESQESLIKVIEEIKQGTLKEICAALGKDWDRERGTVYKALQELIAKGQIEKDGSVYRLKTNGNPPPELFD